jgi:hypothetical protein
MSDDTIIAVITPPSHGYVVDPNDSAAVAWHGVVKSLSPWRAYIWLPSPGASMVLHELAEAMTDPYLNGWYDSTKPRGEISDLCESSPKAMYAPLGRRTGPIGDPHASFIKPMWSNAAKSGAGDCVYARSTRDDLFAIGTDGRLKHRIDLGTSTSSGIFSDWGNFGTGFVGEPAAVSWGYNRLDVFVRSTNGEIHHAISDIGGGSVYWHSYGKPSGYNIISSPAAVSWRPFQVEVYVFAQASPTSPAVLFHRDWDDGLDSGWAAISQLPIGAAGDPGAIAGAYDTPPVGDVEATRERRDLFFIGNDGNLWHGWTPMTSGQPYWLWDNHGRPADRYIFGRVSVASMQRNHLDVYAQDFAGSISHRWCLDDNCGWAVLNAPPAGGGIGGPSAVGLGDGRILVQMPVYGGAIWRNLWDNAWSGWTNSGGGIAGGGVAASYW